jgi:NADPH-dependent 2,4-dienoyl-CoA reductase/sulfur reductase-like enzyme
MQPIWPSTATHSRVPEPLDVAVVGAGPFGLSVAAWLDDLRTCVFGTPMHTWRTLMPPDMLMRSAWEETSLSARGRRGRIDEFAAEQRVERQEPIPLPLFLRYADWFRERFVAEHDDADVVHVEPAGAGFRLQTSAGREVEAGTIVVAVGVTPFPYAPPLFAGRMQSDPRIDFAVRHSAFADLTGRRVTIVGAGQAALETASLAADAGGDVEVLARSPVRWFADREPHTPRGPVGRRLYRIAYPVVGYGPPPINRLAVHPDAFAVLPWQLRRRLTGRLLRAGGSPWIRARVEGRVRLTEGVAATGVDDHGEALRLRLSDGTERDADLVLLATGYQFALDRLDWLAPGLRSQVALDRGWPRLDRRFRSTVPNLLFVGYPAEGRLGPIARFVLGAEFSARRVRGAIVRGGAPGATGSRPRG